MTSLQGNDLGHLRILAEHWGVDFSAPDARVGLQRLVPLLLDKKLVADIYEELTEDVRSALADLQVNGGRMPWARFTQRCGEVRQFGAGKRDRERPDRKPISPAETLWYLGFVARALFDTPDGAIEFAYIPEDLLPLLPLTERGGVSGGYGRAASPGEHAREKLVSDGILDDCCTLLAAFRIGVQDVYLNVPLHFLVALLTNAGVLTEERIPETNETRRFLEMSRGEALAFLAYTWLHSTINDLRMLPTLEAEGEWENNPLRTRTQVVDFLSTIPAGQWWSVTAFLNVIRERHPDFQRPTGDYNSWYLRDKKSGEFLRGYEHWDDVEGAFLRYLICNPLHWLGILDIALPAKKEEVSAFRLSAWAVELLQGKVPVGMAAEEDKVIVHSDARLEISNHVPRAARYQIARFTEWEGERRIENKDVYYYRVTPSSLERAAQQGIYVNHLLMLFNAHAHFIPPNLVKALRRWENNGTEAELEQVVILRMSSPIAMQALKKSPAGRFLGDLLNATTATVKPRMEKYVLAALAELGYLSEFSYGALPLKEKADDEHEE